MAVVEHGVGRIAGGRLSELRDAGTHSGIRPDGALRAVSGRCSELWLLPAARCRTIAIHLAATTGDHRERGDPG